MDDRILVVMGAVLMAVAAHYLLPAVGHKVMSSAVLDSQFTTTADR